jgi:hypothetical protein
MYIQASATNYLCLCVCVRARVRACVRACVCVCVCIQASVTNYLRARVRGGAHALSMNIVPELCVFDLDACLWDKVVNFFKKKIPQTTKPENLKPKLLCFPLSLGPGNV